MVIKSIRLKRLGITVYSYLAGMGFDLITIPPHKKRKVERESLVGKAGKYISTAIDADFVTIFDKYHTDQGGHLVRKMKRGLEPFPVKVPVSGKWILLLDDFAMTGKTFYKAIMPRLPSGALALREGVGAIQSGKAGDSRRWQRRRWQRSA